MRRNSNLRQRDWPALRKEDTNKKQVVMLISHIKKLNCKHTCIKVDIPIQIMAKDKVCINLFSHKFAISRA